MTELAAPGEDASFIPHRADLPTGGTESCGGEGAIPLAPSDQASSSSSRKRKMEKKVKSVKKAKTDAALKDDQKKKSAKARHLRMKKAARKAVLRAGRHFADILGAGGGGRLALATHPAQFSPTSSGRVETVRGVQAGTCYGRHPRSVDR
jgi:hypothetical protein